MHARALELMREAIAKYFRPAPDLRVLDVGSRISGAQTLTHRTIFEGSDVRYTGVDMQEGPNVDLVMRTPYRLPVEEDAYDLVLAGQVFEHVPYPHVLMLELARATKPGGLIMLTAPSRGHQHRYPYDCWRYYPDSWRALATFAELEVVDARTDFPPKPKEWKVRVDYSAIPEDRYWGDSLGVLRKPLSRTSFEARVLRELLVTWANDHAELRDTPAPVKVPTIGRRARRAAARLLFGR